MSWSSSTPQGAEKVTKLDSAAWARYPSMGGTLIPLDGKRPIHTNWTRRRYSNLKVIKKCAAQGRNVGWRIPEDVLVIDIDPRNGATDEVITNFAFEFGFDPLANPHLVRTGGGGWHSFYSVLPGASLVDTLKDFPGVEFKSKGRQVVAAGSIHPESGKRYVIEGAFEGPLLELPQTILPHITRPERAIPVGGGQLDKAQAEAVLAHLDPTHFREQSRWQALMMAVHHATGGDARQEFVDWSISDPQYADQAEIIGRRFDSCHHERAEGVVTIGTLRHFLSEEGQLDALPPDQEGAAKEFDGLDDPDFDATDDGIEESPLKGLNKKHCAVYSGGRYRIMHREEGRWVAASKADFISRYENRSIESGKRGKGNPAIVSLGKGWQEWQGRKTADGTTFDPQAKPSSIVGGALNLWSGFSVEPKTGTCEYFLTMIRDDLCDGNADVFEYVINWTAWKVQNPGSLPETSISFIGAKGTGKTTYGESVAKIFGEHGIVVSDISQVVGRFNGHLETKCFAYLDEAVWGGDKRHESGIKKLITDKSASYEYKGVDIFDGINRVGVISGGNEEWQVPASMDERRFCVSKVSKVHRVSDDAPASHPNRLYWNRVHRELERGGLSAFLYDLLNRNLNGWHPRTGIPRTAAMGEQKLHGLSGVSKWWYEILRDSDLPDVRTESEEADWWVCSLRTSPTSVTARYCEWLHFTKPHANPSSRAVLEELKRWGWEGGEDQHRERTRDRTRYWLMPSLKEGRAKFAARLGTNPFADG
jgi:Bifunctional DNA primase/polymerase, N-terminal/Family of unknown function (DUF5906)/Primase C terminal 2 (PriCT-2)